MVIVVKEVVIRHSMIRIIEVSVGRTTEGVQVIASSRTSSRIIKQREVVININFF